LETRLWLTANEQTAAGMLLQRLPSQTSFEDEDAWPRMVQLSDTISNEELRSLKAPEILHRLFHEEDVRMFDAKPVFFRCACSRERVQNTLRMLGLDEVREVIAEQGSVSVDCEFCHQHYDFDAVDVEALFAADVLMDAPKQQH
jgi:molecular chaperone Hsp33